VRPGAARRGDRPATRHPCTPGRCRPGHPSAPQASPGTGPTGQPEHWRDTGKLPARHREKPPSDIGLTRVTVPEARRLLTASVRGTFGYAWSIWRRRHQARARWHHYQAQLQAAPA